MLTIGALPGSQSRLVLFIIIAFGATLAAAPATAQEHTVIFEDPGRIIAVVGQDCGQAVSATVRLNGSFRLPAYATRATVFLNGWHMRYLSGDHEVRTIHSNVLDIRTNVSEAGRILSWRISGALHDRNDDDGYEFCAHYTVIGWHPRWIDALVDDRDSNFGSGRNSQSPVAQLDRFGPPEIRNPAFAGRARAAILPRGFQLTWDYGPTYGFFSACFSCPIDYNVLQVGYAFRQPASLQGGLTGDTVRWSADGIIKDNDADGFWFGAWVSALVGDDVFVRRGALSLVPRDDHTFLDDLSTCFAGGDRGVVTERFEIAGLQFDYALPLLTGVELYHICDDEEVKEIGAWIHDIEYRRPTNGANGVLRYSLSTVLRDKDSRPPHSFAHKVDILGLFAGGPHGDPPVAP